MNVTDTVRALALVRVFSELHVDIGGRLFASDLRQAWRRITGLRDSDLLLALNTMVARHELRFHEHPDGDLVELTRAGYDHVTGGYQKLTGFVEMIRAHMVLRQSRKRVTGQRPSVSNRQRRQTDGALLA